MFAPLMASETSRNLRRVFKLSEMLKDEAPKDGFKPRGCMSSAPAPWAATSPPGAWSQGMQASLQDLDEAQIARRSPAPRSCSSASSARKLAIDAAVARLIADPTGSSIKHADVVIEAIVEKLEVKQKLFAGAREAR